MKRIISILACLVASGVWGLGDETTTREIVNAARRIAGEKSYAWTSTSVSAEGTYDPMQGPTKGKTEKEGFTYVSFTLRDSHIELGFHQDKSAIKWADKWRASSELEGDVAWIADRLRSYKTAAEEAAFLASNSSDLSESRENEFSGTLGTDALRFLLSRGRREVTEVGEISGSIRFWSKDGHLTKYEYRLQGLVPYGPEGASVRMDRTTTVEFHGIGETEVQVPAEAMHLLR